MNNVKGMFNTEHQYSKEILTKQQIVTVTANTLAEYTDLNAVVTGRLRGWASTGEHSTVV